MLRLGMSLWLLLQPRMQLMLNVKCFPIYWLISKLFGFWVILTLCHWNWCLVFAILKTDFDICLCSGDVTMSIQSREISLSDFIGISLNLSLEILYLRVLNIVSRGQILWRQWTFKISDFPVPATSWLCKQFIVDETTSDDGLVSNFIVKVT